jgi:predicted RNase H-like nuclease (RuvC/YqgF family)
MNFENINEQSGFERKTKFETDNKEVTIKEEVKKEDPEEIEKKRTEEINVMNETLTKLKNGQVKFKEEIINLTNILRQTEEMIQNEKEKKKKLDESYKVIKMTEKLLEDKDNNIIKMEQITKNKSQHLINLSIEWVNIIKI